MIQLGFRLYSGYFVDYSWSLPRNITSLKIDECTQFSDSFRIIQLIFFQFVEEILLGMLLFLWFAHGVLGTNCESIAINSLTCIYK